MAYYRKALEIFGQTQWTGWYRSLVGVPFTKLWRRISAPLPKQASFAATLRSAMHPSVMDVALRVAVAYPVLLLILPWIVSYSDARLGDVTLLQATPFWPVRAVSAVLIAFLLYPDFFLVVRPLLYGRKGGFAKRYAYCRRSPPSCSHNPIDNGRPRFLTRIDNHIGKTRMVLAQVFFIVTLAVAFPVAILVAGAGHI